MIKIKPITELRDTNKISEEAHRNDGPIFITKNGYNDLVIMSDEYYHKQVSTLFKEHKKKRYENISFSSTPSHCHGFVKVACATPNVSLCDPKENLKEIERIIEEISSEKPKIIVFPELSLSGYSCRDIFFQNALYEEVEKSIEKLCTFSKKIDSLIFVGAPLRHGSALYNTAIAVFKGDILGVIPKTAIPNHGEFYELRQFESAPSENDEISINGKYYPFGTKILFRNASYQDMIVGVEICEDLWIPNPPSTDAALNGATIIVNLSASNELVGKKDYRRSLVSSTSARLVSAYLYACAGNGESTTDVVFGGHNLISENGNILKESELFSNETIVSEIDLEKLSNERRKTNTFKSKSHEYLIVDFELPLEIPKLTRLVEKNPFLVNSTSEAEERYRLIVKMQAMGLKKRLEASKNKKAIVGLSGGLDSTLALLVAVEAFKIMDRPLSDIIAMSLPAFGTSKRTRSNAISLAKELEVTYEEINIEKSIKQHFEDISLDKDDYSTTYENAQARERTQVLMDYGNKIGALMIGTSDLSELCLGWTTYGGDHMSMYGVNASVPKTLVKEIIRQYAKDNVKCRNTLFDILDTPISPELLPTEEGKIVQKTEEIIGPYELNDFFIYYFLRHNFSPKKILFLAKYAYEGIYDEETIRQWLKKFISRFFNNQFKRSCLPDGIKIGSVGISPRGDLRMPSDASGQSLIDTLD